MRRLRVKSGLWYAVGGGYLKPGADLRDGESIAFLRDSPEQEIVDLSLPGGKLSKHRMHILALRAGEVLSN